jgi:hypothetical protein
MLIDFPFLRFKIWNALFILLLSLPAAGSQSSQLVCEQFASKVRQHSPVRGEADPWQSVVESLRKDPKSGLQLSGFSPRDSKEVLSELRQKYKADKKLQDLASSIAENSETLDLVRIGNSSVYVLEAIAGSAYCVNFTFFKTAENSNSSQILAPSVLDASDPTLCWDGLGFTGKAFENSVFITESSSSKNEFKTKITIVPWEGARWQPACEVEVRFPSKLKITQQFCGETNCQQVVDKGLELASLWDRDAKGFRKSVKNSRVNLRDFERMKSLFGNSQNGANVRLPSFGKEIMSSYDSFATRPEQFIVNIGDETYFGIISRAYFGWRESPDILFAAYKLSKDKLEPVVGAFVSKTRGSPEKIEVHDAVPLKKAVPNQDSCKFFQSSPHANAVFRCAPEKK